MAEKSKTKVYIDGANMFYTQRKDEIIIFSGDSDFQYLVRKLKDASKKVSVYSSRKTISWELKLEASNIFYLEDIKNQIKRE